MKRLNLIGLGLALLLSACATQDNSDLDAYQSKFEQITGNYARGVSAAFGGNSRGISRGVTGTWPNNYGSNYGSSYPYQGNYLPGYGELFGGYVVQNNLNQDAQDCVSMSEAVPEIGQNFNYMLASLARCLDKVAANKNPMMSYGYRRMPYAAQQNWAYLMNFRRAGARETFPQTDFSMLNSFAAQGYY